ncbi:hypothetical protein E2C01_032255 [Portunus trituberculatus]|uniref:Uncharacterized protein n=1 Tax=Portunus trituberculatus TaxID=210409 RepID=A0A5B7EX15_PORTR|nr:hypothetical protein [Portunus trituberculatus]
MNMETRHVLKRLISMLLLYFSFFISSLLL